MNNSSKRYFYFKQFLREFSDLTKFHLREPRTQQGLSANTEKNPIYQTYDL